MKNQKMRVYFAGIFLILMFGLPFMLRKLNRNRIAMVARNNRFTFAREVLQVIAVDRPQENVIYSPLSMQTSLALAYCGARGRAAEELRIALRFGRGRKKFVARVFAKFFEDATKQVAGGTKLIVTNRLYIKKDMRIMPEFSEIASIYFNSEVKQLNGNDTESAVSEWNNHTTTQTNVRIKNALSQSVAESDTTVVLVNEIYFIGKWAQAFTEHNTHKSNFMVNINEPLTVNMMHRKDTLCNYVELPYLDAIAVELRYNNSDVSMLILLPNKVNGLQKLERALTTIDLNYIVGQLKEEYLNIYLPKFSISLDIELEQPLQKLGITTMFTGAANFSDLLTDGSAYIEKVVHKAWWDVSESGSETAAAKNTLQIGQDSSFQSYNRTVRVDHPFAFAIRSKDAVYFAGHVVKP